MVAQIRRQSVAGTCARRFDVPALPAATTYRDTMFETVQRQLTLAEQAWEARRLGDAVKALATAQARLLEQAATWNAQVRSELETQVDALAELGLVVSDLDAKLAEAGTATDPVTAATLLEQVKVQVQEMLDPTGKLLVRTNIFERGKKTFLAFAPNETLGDIAKRLKARYREQIVAHFAGRGIQVAVPEALDIVFFGSLIWERPDEAVLSEHERVADVVEAEPDGLIWFPVLPGDTPSLLGLEDDEDEASAMSILENFTVEADVHRLEDDMRQVAERLETDQPASPTPGDTISERRAVLVKDHGTPSEKRIPLVGEAISLGRSRATDIQILNDARVSRHHCTILREGEAFFIEDNGSSNGTLVNGERVQRARLEDGDTIGVGDTEFLFLVE